MASLTVYINSTAIDMCRKRFDFFKQQLLLFFLLSQLQLLMPKTYVSPRLRMNFDYFLHLYPCKIDKDNQDLLKIRSCSIKEREKLSKQGGDEDATEEGDSGTINPKSFDCTCK